MSVNHTRRYEKVVDDALKLAAMGEAYGYAVCGPSMWPIIVEQPPGSGNYGLTPPAPAWYVQVSLQATGIGEPDVVNGFPIAGFLPDDSLFRQVATNMLELCRREREQANAKALAAASLDAQRKAAQG